jgi:hypothetical protein
MKKIKKVLAIALVLTSMSIIPVNAEETGQTIYHYGDGTSGTTPPTPTQAAVAGFAVVNNEGVVKGAIACSVSFCPTVLEGTYMDCTNCKLVQQTPAIPDGNAFGYVGTPNNPVKYDSQEQVFTQGSTSTPAPVTRNETVDTTTISVTINSDVVTFGPNSFVNGQMQVTPRVNSNTGATISATQTNYETRTVTSATGIVTTELVATTESQSFTSPQTREQIAQAVQYKSFLQRRLDRIYVMLRGWVLD